MGHSGCLKTVFPPQINSCDTLQSVSDFMLIQVELDNLVHLVPEAMQVYKETQVLPEHLVQMVPLVQRGTSVPVDSRDHWGLWVPLGPLVMLGLRVLLAMLDCQAPLDRMEQLGSQDLLDNQEVLEALDSPDSQVLEVI